MSNHLVSGNEDNALAWKVIFRMCDEYFKNGVNVLLKQTVASQDMVNQFLDLAKKYKCSIVFYHFRAPKNILLKRINKRKKRKVTKLLIMKNIGRHEVISYDGAKIINTLKMTPNEVIKLILNDLKIK